jgi:hypothetical protein
VTLKAPEWLERRGELKIGSDGNTWFVLLRGQPTYSLKAVPVQGKFGCAIRETHNGRRIESTNTCSTWEEALSQGLEDLRKALGWE